MSIFLRGLLLPLLLIFSFSRCPPWSGLALGLPPNDLEMDSLLVPLPLTPSQGSFRIGLRYPAVCVPLANFIVSSLPYFSPYRLRTRLTLADFTTSVCLPEFTYGDPGGVPPAFLGPAPKLPSCIWFSFFRSVIDPADSYLSLYEPFFFAGTILPSRPLHPTFFIFPPFLGLAQFVRFEADFVVPPPSPGRWSPVPVFEFFA